MNLRGTVLRVRLDPTEGREQAGVRPAVVISSTFFNERSDLLIVAPITSKRVDQIFPFQVLLSPVESGLDVPSKVLLNQIRTIDKARVVGQYGLLDETRMSEVDEAMKLALGLTPI